MHSRATWLAAAVFASLAIAATGVVRASGEQIVDTSRYADYAESIESGLVPYRDFDVEYPPGALLVFLAPAVVTTGTSTYFWTFAGLMAIAGALGVFLTSAALERLGRSPRERRWVLALVAVSPVAFGGVLLTRFDLVVAALVAGATLGLLRDRARLAAILLGAGAAVKLYPLLLLPLLAVWVWRRRGGRQAATASAIALGVAALAYVPFVVLSPEGVAYSIWRQLSRPLQIESLGAGVLVLLDNAAALNVVVETSSGSQNLVGTTAVAVAVSSSLVGIAAIVSLCVSFAREPVSDERLVRFVAALLVAFVAFGKVLSPQFLVWLLFPLALVGGRRGAAAGVCFAVAAVATAIWFPWRYFELPRELDPLVGSLVVLRGAALVAVLIVLATPSRRATPRS